MRRGTKYLVVIEKGKNSYGAFVPDLPGCVAVAKSAREVRRLIAEAIDLHLLDLSERGESIPPARAVGQYVESRPVRRGRAA